MLLKEISGIDCMNKSLRKELLRFCRTSPDLIKVVCEDPTAVYVADVLPKKNLDDDIESKINIFWDELAAKEKCMGNTTFFNGMQCAVKKFEHIVGTKTMGVHLFVTDYKHAVASKKANIGPELWLVGNSGAIVFRSPAGERNYVFGERSRNVQDVGGTLELPPAGYIDIGNPRIMPSLEYAWSSPIFEANIMDEREEELGFPFESTIPSEKTGKIQAVGIIKIVPYRDYNVSHVIEMNTSREEVEEIFEHRKKKNELDKVHVVPESNLLKFMKERGNTLGPRARSHFEHMIKYADIVNEDF